MSSQQPYQNMPSSVPPGYAYSPDQGAQEYAQPGLRYAPPVGYGQPAYPGGGDAIPDPLKGWAITGLLLGFLSLLVWIIPEWGGYLELVCITLGLVFSSLGMKSTTSRDLAIVGLVLSIILLVILVTIIILFSIAVANSHYPFY